MTDTNLPAPLVPADVDLQDFAFMPLDVARLRDSDLASEETPEACWAAVLLWCASWHQVPAGSIPDSEQWQAKQAGYVSRGRVDPAWAKQVRAGALRGWVLCSDGRLYHPVVAEKARDAWQSKLMQRWKTECARIKKHNQRHGMSLALPEFSEWMSRGCPQGQELPVPGDTDAPSQGHGDGVQGDGRECPPGSPEETTSKRQGEGQRQLLKKEERASSDPPFARARVHEGPIAEQAAQAMREAGFDEVVAEDPALLAVLAQGITVAELRAAALEAKKRKKGAAWAYARAVGRRADAVQQQAAAAEAAVPATVAPSESAAAYVERMAAEREAERNRPAVTVDVAALAAKAKAGVRGKG